MVGGVNVACDFEKTNNAESLFASENPAFAMISHAKDLVRFYDFLIDQGQSNSGKQLLTPETIDRYTLDARLGWNRSLNTFMAVSRGFQAGSRFLPSAYGWWGAESCFGHGGAFSSLAFADKHLGLSVAIITNGNRGLADFSKRFIPLTHSLRQACYY